MKKSAEETRKVKTKSKVKATENNTTICCIGSNNIGMITCCVIAKECPNVRVAIVDSDPLKFTMWNTKIIPFHEPGLEEIVKECLSRNLIFTADMDHAIAEANMIFLSFNNTFYDKDEFCGLKTSEMEEIARVLGRMSDNNKIIVEKSTVPVGSNQLLKYLLECNKKSSTTFQVVSNPEFCSQGEIVSSLLNPDRIVIGSNQTNQGLAAAKELASIYAKWVPAEKILMVNNWSAELGKLAANAFLAQKISSMSSFSLLCWESKKLDVSEILRIYAEVTGNPHYLEPTFRFGGKNLQRDLLCLIFMCRELKLNEAADYWQQVLDMNELHMLKFKKLILAEFAQTLVHKKIAIFGFAYKKGVKTAEDSPALNLSKMLLEEGATLSIFDPEIDNKVLMDEFANSGLSKWEQNVHLVNDPYKATMKANAIVCCTDWDEFKKLKFEIIYKNMVKPAYIFDGRKFLPHQELIDMDFIVKTIGVDLCGNAESAT